MSGYTTIPYVIAYANELVEDPIAFVEYAGRLQLSYLSPRPSDWAKPPSPWGCTAARILRARVRDLRDRPDKRGPERMRKLNTTRQWRCMDKLWCQVCGEPAVDLETGSYPWLLFETVFEATGEDSGRTNAPPTCWLCVPRALAECPKLESDPILCVAKTVRSAGVLADVYAPGIAGEGALTDRNAFIGWDWTEFHHRSLAVAQVVELRGLKILPI